MGGGQRLGDAEGSAGALEAFVRSAYGPVRRLCAVLVDEASADDIAQDVFSKAVPALATYRGEASPTTWVLAIARNTCNDELRRRTRRRRLAHLVGRGEEPAADASEESTVADLLGRLEPDRRAAFALTQLLGLSYEEAAAVCGCPIGTIRSRIARARADLLSSLSHSAAADDGLDGPAAEHDA